MFLEDYFALIVNGVAIGAIYAMVGISFNIAYRPTNVFNLAQGELVMLGAMGAWVLMSVVGLPWALAAIGVIIAIALLAGIEERVAVAPHFRGGAHDHGWLISTLAFSIIIINWSDKLFRADPRLVQPIPGTSLQTHMIGPVAFNTHQIAVVVIAVGSIFLLEYIYKKTMIGKAISAVAEDRDGARLNGINPFYLTALSFVAAGGYCAIIGLAAAPLLLASTSLGLMLLVKGFTAMALGGVGSNWGTLIGGILIGVIDSLSSVLVSAGFRPLVIFVVLLSILLIRPQGIFGTPPGRVV
jgi:branched-chain amino acid transport system permease protein